MKLLKNKNLSGVLMNYSNVVVYHRTRKVFRLFTSSERSKWNKVLGYCHKSMEFAAEDRFIDRTLDEYEKCPTYVIFYTNDDLTDYRTIEDVADTYPENFI